MTAHRTGTLVARQDTILARRILLAARELIAQRGVHASRVEDIAREACCAMGTVVYCFGSKDGLLVEVLAADAHARVQQLHDRAGRASSRRELLDAVTERVVTGGSLAELELTALAARTHGLAAARAQARRRYRDALAEILAAKQRAGIVTLTGPPTSVADVLVALEHGVAEHALATGDGDLTAQAAVLIDAMLSPGD